MTPDLNEQITIKTLYKLLISEKQKACAIIIFQQKAGLEEKYFIETLRSIQRQSLVEIGFFRRGQIIKVQNWYEKYPVVEDFYIKLTTRGCKYCSS